MKRFLSMFLLCVWAVSAGAQSKLVELWQDPPEQSRPWNFWYWMYGAFTREGITADLQAMKDNGLEGAYQFTIRGIPDPPHIQPSYNQLSPEWWDIWSFAVREADRLGVKLAFNACDGWAVAGGPWITPEMSMQILTWSETTVRGGGQVDITLPQPPSKRDYYRDIATFAWPSRKGEGVQSRDLNPKIISDRGKDLSFLSIEGNTKPYNSAKPSYFTMEFREPLTVRSIYIRPRNVNYQAVRMRMQVSDDGVNFREVLRMEPPRLGWYSWIVPAFTYAIPETTAKYFRFINDPSGGEVMDEDNDKAKAFEYFSILEINLRGDVLIDQFESKNGEAWRVAKTTSPELVGKGDCVPECKLLDISEYVSADGTLHWKAPKGDWTILRMGYTTNGAENRPAGGAIGLECDRFNSEAIRLQMDSWIGHLKEVVGSEIFERTVKYLHVDSWECGSQNWSPVFRDEFKSRKGYDIVKVLPIMAGVPVKSLDYSEKVLWDVRDVISSLYADVFFRQSAEYAHSIGCEFSCEAMAPVTMSDDMLHYKYSDHPMGEFWLNSPTQDKPSDILDAVSGAHVYGKNLVGAEAFTETSIRWDEYPGMLKPLQDFEYAAGINHLVFHVNAHNPWVGDRVPGMTLDKYGLYFQRNQTWWKLGKAWMDYTIRCQTLLLAGKPVVDIAVWTGDDYPRRAVTNERLVPLLPGLYGPERVRSEAERMAADPMERDTSACGVIYPKNASLPQDWINPLHGYRYDSFNSDALCNLASGAGKRLTLSSGMEYGVLVVPPTDIHQPNGIMTDRTRKAIAALKKAGVPVIDKFPFPDSDLSALGIVPDFTAYDDSGYVEGLVFCHRRTAEEDIYFIANHDGILKNFKAGFRVTGRTPEIWLPVSGEIISRTEFAYSGSGVEMPLTLAPYESIFVVFKDDSKESFPGGNSIVTFEVCPISGPWEVTFPLDNGPKTVTFDSLTDWKDSADSYIRYFSGTATYKTSFSVTTSLGRCFLEFDKVCNLARMVLNGVDCGTLWTPPYRIDVTSALRPGENVLEVEVVNTWANYMKGRHEQKIDGKPFWTLVPYWADVPLQESGIIGNVRITTN